MPQKPKKNKIRIKINIFNKTIRPYYKFSNKVVSNIFIEKIFIFY